MTEWNPLIIDNGQIRQMGVDDIIKLDNLPEDIGNSNTCGNLDGGKSDSVYGGITGLDCGSSLTE